MRIGSGSAMRDWEIGIWNDLRLPLVKPASYRTSEVASPEPTTSAVAVVVVGVVRLEK